MDLRCPPSFSVRLHGPGGLPKVAEPSPVTQHFHLKCERGLGALPRVELTGQMLWLPSRILITCFAYATADPLPPFARHLSPATPVIRCTIRTVSSILRSSLGNLSFSARRRFIFSSWTYAKSNNRARGTGDLSTIERTKSISSELLS